MQSRAGQSTAVGGQRMGRGQSEVGWGLGGMGRSKTEVRGGIGQMG